MFLSHLAYAHLPFSATAGLLYLPRNALPDYWFISFWNVTHIVFSCVQIFLCYKKKIKLKGIEMRTKKREFANVCSQFTGKLDLRWCFLCFPFVVITDCWLMSHSHFKILGCTILYINHFKAIFWEKKINNIYREKKSQIKDVPHKNNMTILWWQWF